ncbi:MAG: Co2+/Mg2+ efflux protein ApaG [Flavobacteriales bacterium]|nr:Co2+/Mg2+ efflux protein ApaG [Flavobacteriales bacterium]
MPAFLTDKVSVKVKPSYEAAHSSPAKHEYYFSYSIQISNEGNSAIQLLSRHWFIFDSNGQYSEIKGEGVLGEQPIIHPNQTHAYQSFCHLKSDIGMMWGTYLMKIVDTGKLFEVSIPEFQMITPMRLN